MPMDLQQLEIFMAVAEHRSFTRAAESLYISHSTTSRNVSALEESLGVTLVNRDNRTVGLTPAGEVLYREGKGLLGYTESILDMVRSVGLGHGRRLTVAVAPMVPKELPESVRDFCTAQPEVCVSVRRCEIAEVWRMVDSGEADLGVTVGASLPDVNGAIESIAYYRGELKLAVGGNDELARFHEVDINSLAGREFVAEPITSRYVSGEVRAKNRITTVPSVDSVLLRVATGGAIAIVPDFLVAGTKYGCQLIDIQNAAGEDAVLIWRKKNQNPSLEGLLRGIKKLIT